MDRQVKYLLYGSLFLAHFSSIVVIPLTLIAIAFSVFYIQSWYRRADYIPLIVILLLLAGIHEPIDAVAAVLLYLAIVYTLSEKTSPEAALAYIFGALCAAIYFMRLPPSGIIVSLCFLGWGLLGSRCGFVVIPITVALIAPEYIPLLIDGIVVMAIGFMMPKYTDVLMVVSLLAFSTLAFLNIIPKGMIWTDHILLILVVTSIGIITRYQRNQRGYFVAVLLTIGLWTLLTQQQMDLLNSTMLLAHAIAIVVIWLIAIFYRQPSPSYPNAIADTLALIILLPILLASVFLKRRNNHIHSLVNLIYLGYLVLWIVALLFYPFAAVFLIGLLLSNILIIRIMYRQLRDGWLSLWIWGTTFASVAMVIEHRDPFTIFYSILLLIVAYMMWRNPRGWKLILSSALVVVAQIIPLDVMTLAILLALWSDHAPLPPLKLVATK